MYLGSEGALDVEGKELPRLVYVSREKRPGYQHHKKAGAMNALVSVSSPTSNNLRQTMEMDLKVSSYYVAFYRFESLPSSQMHHSS